MMHLSEYYTIEALERLSLGYEKICTLRLTREIKCSFAMKC